MPQIAIDLGLFQAGDKPGPVIETVLRALTREQATLHAMPWNLARLDRSDGVSVQMHGALVTVLRLRQLDRLAVQMHLVPVHGVLFGEAHPAVDRDDELGQVFRKQLLDRGVEAGVLVLTAKEPDASIVLSAVGSLPRWILLYLLVLLTDAVAEREERLVPVPID